DRASSTLKTSSTAATRAYQKVLMAHHSASALVALEEYGRGRPWSLQRVTKRRQLLARAVSALLHQPTVALDLDRLEPEIGGRPGRSGPRVLDRFEQHRGLDAKQSRRFVETQCLAASTT